MKLIVKLYRVTTIRTAELMAGCGLDPEKVIDGAALLTAVKNKFKPLAPRFHIFAPPDTTVKKTVVGTEAISFDVLEADAPMAGLVYADPMKPEDIARIDGSIESELNRLNCSTDFIGYEWRCAYTVIGN